MRSEQRALLGRVRRIKLGLQLANALLTKFDEATASDLVGRGLQARLLALIERRTGVAEPLRLRCVTCLENSLQAPTGVRFLVESALDRRVSGLFERLEQSARGNGLLALSERRGTHFGSFWIISGTF